jgi:hypothetical protein
MSFFCRLSRKHYWSVPHRNDAKVLVHVCYECGAEREARELHKEAVEMAPQKPPMTRIAPSRMGVLRKLVTVK